jgi:UDP-glucose 4-epimerase
MYADPSMAQQLLGWRTQLDIESMCQDAWRWQSMNPDGYETRKTADRIVRRRSMREVAE